MMNQDMGAALVGSWSATYVRGEEFPQETIVEFGGVEQGPETRTRELILYEGGRGELIMQTRFISMLSKVENVSRTIYKARVTVDEEPDYTIRLTRDNDLVVLDCALDDMKLRCTERDVEDNGYGEPGVDYDRWTFKL